MGLTVSEKLILKDLEFGPATERDLQDAVHITRVTVYRLMRHLKAEDLVHIVDWERSRGGPRAVWAIGPGKDKPRLRAMTPTEKTDAHRKRNWEHYLAMHRAWWNAHKDERNAMRRKKRTEQKEQACHSSQ